MSSLAIISDAVSTVDSKQSKEVVPLHEFKGRTLDGTEFEKFIRSTTDIWYLDQDIELVEYDAAHDCLRLTCATHDAAMSMVSRYHAWTGPKAQVHETSPFKDDEEYVGTLRARRISHSDWMNIDQDCLADSRIVRGYYHRERRALVVGIMDGTCPRKFYEDHVGSWKGPFAMVMKKTQQIMVNL